ncbi:anti-sigma factor family protein [Pseudomonas sp.]|uniref:anti-sigma factor family protein n=1 Tax=Pseudomonas sp. TaxID=306 RepID=UPI003D105B64
MTHDVIDEATLQAYVDGWLSPRQRAQVEARLLLCRAEAARVRAYQAQREVIKVHAGGGQDDAVPGYLIQSVVRAPIRPRRWTCGGILLFLVGVAFGWGVKQAVQTLTASGVPWAV